jgi:hypothetical protein
MAPRTNPPLHSMLARFVACAGVLLLVPWASSDDGQTASGVEIATASETATRGFWRNFEPHARLVGRVGADRVAGATETGYDTENLRLALRWNPTEWFRAEVEYDVADGTPLKDAYLRFRAKSLAIKLGRFKPPSSSIELESRFDLPTADRELLYDVLVGHMGWAGRRPGIELAWAASKHVDARFGVFQASHTLGNRVGTASFDNLVKLGDTSPDTLAAAGRITYSRSRAELGLYGEWRPAEPVPGAGYRRFWATGSDFSWSDKPKRGGRRIWLDAMIGSSWQDTSAFDDDPAVFCSARLIASWRRGGRKTGAFYLEPFVAGGILDPDTTMRADAIWDVVGGLNVGLWRRLRLTLEGRQRQYGRNVPPALGLLKWMGEPPLSSSGFILQVGTYY